MSNAEQKEELNFRIGQGRTRPQYKPNRFSVPMGSPWNNKPKRPSSSHVRRVLPILILEMPKPKSRKKQTPKLPQSISR